LYTNMLLKCKECGQDVSTDAPFCPHCGKPNTPVIAPVVDDGIPKKGTGKALTGFSILALIGILIYFSPHQIWQSLFSTAVPTVFNPPQTISGHEVRLETVKNLGYEFSLGQIDTAGTNNLTDDFKNQVTKIVYDAHFPQSVLSKIPIIVLNNLALTGDQYIKTSSGILKIPELKGDWLSEGGIYGTFTNGTGVIFINKPIIAKGQLTEVLTHELGHAIGSKLTDQDWQKYYQLRGIPAGTARHGTNWNTSPDEDFAEVYKNTYTGIPIRTYYGKLVSNLSQGIEIGSCMLVYQNARSNYMPKSTNNFGMPSFSTEDYSAVSAKTDADPKVQACRREVMLNPSAHQSDWAFGTPYKFVVTQNINDFILKISL